jgi:glucosylceramidase
MLSRRYEALMVRGGGALCRWSGRLLALTSLIGLPTGCGGDGSPGSTPLSGGASAGGSPDGGTAAGGGLDDGAGMGATAGSLPVAGNGGQGAGRSVTSYTTSAAGNKLAEASEPDMLPAPPPTTSVVRVDIDEPRQVIVGFGGSFTESAAAVLAKLSAAKRAEVLSAYFSPEGANYSLTRTHIGSCDFSLDKYSYAATASFDLGDFSVAPDDDDLIPLILDAQALSVDGFEIIASPWTAPPWMKTIGDWYQPPAATNGYHGTGGKLKPEYAPTYALYLSKYVSAYEAVGIPIWAITPENEPLGNSGQWESMEFSAAEMNAFVRDHLGPLFATEHPSTKIFGFDQNREQALDWANALLGDPRTQAFVSGTAVHWYASTFKVYAEVLDQLHAAYPDKMLLNSEATIDALRDEALEMSPPGDTSVPWGKANGQLHYWKDDGWWWQKNASDWGYFWADGSAGTSPADRVDHPLYEPVYRYARDIIEGLNHWFVGWVDWNLALNHLGGPNHAGNWAAAPVMIDTDAQDIYYTPLYYVMAHFSKFSRPGARVLETTISSDLPLIATSTLDDSGSVALHVLNMTDMPWDYVVAVDGRTTTVRIPAASLQTIVIR